MTRRKTFIQMRYSKLAWMMPCCVYLIHVSRWKCKFESFYGIYEISPKPLVHLYFVISWEHGHLSYTERLQGESSSRIILESGKPKIWLRCMVSLMTMHDKYHHDDG